MNRAHGAAAALSVVVPTLDEAATLPALLLDLAGQHGIHLEVIVADGGSTDATVALAKATGASVIVASRGRAAQLNAGCRQATAPWLLCLHADSRLASPDQLALALARMRAEALHTPLLAGHWPLRFARHERRGHSLMFRQLEAKSASNRPGTVNGDQGLLIHRDALTACGGFDESLPFFEDQRLAAKVFAEGRFVLLPGVIETSARRFETEGHRNRLVLMALMVGAENAGLGDWLRAVPTLYRNQREASQLSLSPFLQSLAAHIAQQPAAQRRAIWAATGQLLTANAWQLALLLDQISRNQDARWLARFDRELAAAVKRPPFPRLAGSLMAAGIHLAAQLSKYA